MNPATVINKLMHDAELSALDLAELVSVPVSEIARLLHGDSPDSDLYGPLADVLSVSERFIRLLYFGTRYRAYKRAVRVSGVQAGGLTN